MFSEGKVRVSVDDPNRSKKPQSQIFPDRTKAGRALARALAEYAGRSDLLVLALPRGGVPVAFEVAQALKAPLDVFLVRKLGVPSRAELAMGAIALGGVRVLNEEVVNLLEITPEAIEAVAARERQELERQDRDYRALRPLPDLAGKTVVLIDDGLATGSTMQAAIQSARRQGPARIVVAVPVAAPATCKRLASEADEIICLHTPESFRSVGLWYEDFSPTTDDQVRDLLSRSPSRSEPEEKNPGPT